MGQGPCLCPRLVSFLLECPECGHQCACRGENWCKRLLAHLKMECCCQRQVTATPKAVCSSQQNLNLPVEASSRQAQDRGGSIGRGERPGMITCGWRGGRERNSDNGGEHFPCQSMSRGMGNTDQFCSTDLDIIGLET